MDEQQTKIYTAIIITCLTVGAVMVFFIVSLIRQQKMNSRLFIEKITAEITTLENERTRMAADLHDELAPLMFSVKFKITGLDLNKEDQQSIEKANLYIDDIIQRIKEISNNLMPNTLLRKGVLQALEEYIANLSGNESLQIHFIHKNIPAIATNMSINIYRLVMEIIHNSFKHAKASYLHIEFKHEEDKLLIVTKDNGVGFEYEPGKQNGYGLRNMLNRAEIMNGDLFIETKLGKGTQFTIELPLDTKN